MNEKKSSNERKGRAQKSSFDINQWSIYDKRMRLLLPSNEQEKKHSIPMLMQIVVWFNFVSAFGFVYGNLIFFKHEMLF